MAFWDLIQTGLSLVGGPIAGIQAGLSTFAGLQGSQEAVQTAQIARGDLEAVAQSQNIIQTQRDIRTLQGKNRVQTVIQTINPAGKVIKTVTQAGRPFLMQKDFTIAKRVIKLAAAAAARIPRKRVQEGIGAQITRAVKQKVLSTIVNGGNGNGKALTVVDTE